MVSAKKLVCFTLASMAIAFTVTVKATVDCNKVLSTLEPCLSFVQGAGSQPSPACCSGAKTVFNNANTTLDRQQTCQCLKDTANQFPGMFKPERVAVLPSDCGIHLPYNISTSINCKSIKLGVVTLEKAFTP